MKLNYHPDTDSLYSSFPSGQALTAGRFLRASWWTTTRMEGSWESTSTMRATSSISGASSSARYPGQWKLRGNIGLGGVDREMYGRILPDSWRMNA